MTDFLTDLYNYITENMPSLRNDPEYQQALQAYMEIEAEVKEKTGGELLDRYQQAEIQVSFLRNLEILRHSLRFGAQFALAVLS